jgi:hypothetical protein
MEGDVGYMLLRVGSTEGIVACCFLCGDDTNAKRLTNREVDTPSYTPTLQQIREYRLPVTLLSFG